MSTAEEAIREIKSFFRFDLRKKGTIIQVTPYPGGWRVLVEATDTRRDPNKSYYIIHERNIYQVDIDRQLNIEGYWRVGRRRKDGEIEEFSYGKSIAKEAKGIDKNMAKEIAQEIAKNIPRGIGIGGREKGGIEIAQTFIDPTEKAQMNYNFDRLGEVKKTEQKVDKAVERLKAFRKTKKK